MLRITGILLFIFTFQFSFAQKKMRELKVDTLGNFSVCTHDSLPSKIYLEQFKWNHWMKIDSINKQNSIDTCWSGHISLYTTKNYFRISHAYNGNTISRDSLCIKKKSGNDSCYYNDCIYCKSTLEFGCKIEWKIYDNNGKLMKKGFSKQVDVSDLPKGGYFLETAYYVTEFFKK
jgi:hypothetical protein